MSYWREWIQVYAEELAVAGILLSFGVAIGIDVVFFAYGHSFLGYVSMMASIWLIFRCFSRWNDWFGYAEKEVAIPDLEVPDRDDPEAEEALLDGMAKLPEEYQEILRRRNINVEIVHDAAVWNNGGVPHAMFTTFGDGREKITIYSWVMRKYQEKNQMTADEFHDWMYRILMHEIGHADGRSDKDMAEASGY